MCLQISLYSKDAVADKTGNRGSVTIARSGDLRAPLLVNYLVTGTATNTVLTLSTNAASLWYELAVARQLFGFDLWRSANFTAAELANLNISGESAAPAGDGVANLLKYYLGLPAKTLAPPERLPGGGLLTANNPLFLVMSYERDKAAWDVGCVPEVSSNLAAWFSGSAHTTIAGVGDLGARDRVTVR